MQKLKNTNQKGFISIVAMIIFAILVITGLSVQRANIDRLENIRNTNNFLAAKNLSKSVIGRLQQIMDTMGPGYNFKAHCEFSGGELSIKGTTTEEQTFCRENFLKVINPCTIKSYSENPICKSGLYDNNEIVIDAEIKGRNETPVRSCNYLGGTECYVIPALGEGTAGEREVMPVKNALNRDCDLYKTENKATELDHECNWNRLSFGSTATDRVVIPLYYTDANGDTIEFHKTSPNAHFVLRVRTPCKVWKTDGTCNNRYTLDTGVNNSENDIVLQWQITGECDDGTGETQECGMIPWVKFQLDNTLETTSSGISEDRINNSTMGDTIVLKSVNVGTNKLRAIDTLTYLNTGTIFNQLKLITTPSLVLFLSKPLIEDYPKNGIPYLEYQLLSYGKISNPSAEIEVKAKVNGNNFESKIQKSVSGALIDFAIQN